MFKVGDVVEVKRSARYSITWPTSWGRIITVYDDQAEIEFFYIASGNLSSGTRWWIHLKDLSLKEPSKTKEQLVINKIYALYKKNRHTKHWERKVDDSRACPS